MVVKTLHRAMQLQGLLRSSTSATITITVLVPAAINKISPRIESRSVSLPERVVVVVVASVEVVVVEVAVVVVVVYVPAVPFG